VKPVSSAVDSSGLPWDARIHASSKTTNADGTWRAKRGVDPILVRKIEGELRGVMAIPAPAPVPAATQAVLIPPAPPAVPVPAPVQITPQMQADFVALVGRASSAMNAGKITEAEVNQCAQSAGVPSLPLLGSRLDLLPQVAAMIDGIIAGRSA
jgi:hypothetical protein